MVLKKELTEKIVNLHNQGKNNSEITRILKIQHRTVANHLKVSLNYIALSNMSKTKRKYNLNQDYFNDINEENAEVLGYLWTMGEINSKNELVFYDTVDKLTWFSNKLENQYLIRPMPRIGKDIHFLKIRFCNRLISRLHELGFDDKQLTTIFPEIRFKELFVKGLLFNNNSKKFKIDDSNMIETRFKSEKLVNELCNLLKVVKKERFGGYWILHIKI